MLFKNILILITLLSIPAMAKAKNQDLTHNMQGGPTGIPAADFSTDANTVWTIITSVFVLFLQIGLAFFDAGKVRYKNV